MYIIGFGLFIQTPEMGPRELVTMDWLRLFGVFRYLLTGINPRVITNYKMAES